MLVVWKKKDNNYYYKSVKGFYCNYEVGYINQYGHEIVLIINDFGYLPYKSSFPKKFLKKTIRFLKGIERSI